MKLSNVYIGCSGWFYEHWRGVFYPESLGKREWLDYYTKFFNTVEINSSFYRMPTERLLKSWYQRTPEDFLFTLKVYRGITHTKIPGSNSAILKRFYKLSEILGVKLGCILFQFPPSFKKDMEVLREFVSKLDKDKKNVLEFRHRTWFDEEVLKYLKEEGIGYCIVSAPDVPLILDITTDFLYIRWHGKRSWYDDNYTRKDLIKWAKIIRDFIKQRGVEVYGYFNNDFMGFAVKNALELRSILMKMED